MSKGDYNKTSRVDYGDKDLKDTKYPYAQVWETESGHVLMFDDTPEGPKIFLGAESGSYIMMTTDGKVINFTVGDRQDYAKGGTSFTVDENYDLKVHGHSRVTVGGGSYVEVAGHAGVGVAGDVALMSKGNLHASIDNFYLGAKGDFNVNAGGDMNLKVKGNMNMETAKTMNMKSKATSQDTSDTHNIKGGEVRINDPSDGGNEGGGGTIA